MTESFCFVTPPALVCYRSSNDSGLAMRGLRNDELN